VEVTQTPAPGRARTGRCSRRVAHSALASSPCSHGPRRRSYRCWSRRISTAQIRTAGAPSAAAGCSPPQAPRSGSSRQPDLHSTAAGTCQTWRTMTRTPPARTVATLAIQDPRRRLPWRPACPSPRRLGATAPPR
jgi:hypothetical protein